MVACVLLCHSHMQNQTQCKCTAPPSQILAHIWGFGSCLVTLCLWYSHHFDRGGFVVASCNLTAGLCAALWFSCWASWRNPQLCACVVLVGVFTLHWPGGLSRVFICLTGSVHSPFTGVNLHCWHCCSFRRFERYKNLDNYRQNSELPAVICIACGGKLQLSVGEQAQNQTTKSKVYKYYWPQSVWSVEAFLCRRNSSSFPVCHISTPCSLGCIIHHISPLFITLSITCYHLLHLQRCP